MSYPTQIGEVGQVIPFQAHPQDSKGAEPLDGGVPISFTIDDPTIASAQMLNNATLQGQFTLLKAGTTIVHLDATSNGSPLSEGRSDSSESAKRNDLRPDFRKPGRIKKPRKTWTQ